MQQFDEFIFRRSKRARTDLSRFETKQAIKKTTTVECHIISQYVFVEKLEVEAFQKQRTWLSRKTESSLNGEKKFWASPSVTLLYAFHYRSYWATAAKQYSA